MRVRHTIAAGLAGILLIQSAAVAQADRSQAIQTISHEQGLEILLRNLQIGADLQIDLADGRRVEGRLVEKSAQSLVVLDRRQRQFVATADVVDVRIPTPTSTRITGGAAFGIGAAIGAGVILGWFFSKF